MKTADERREQMVTYDEMEDEDVQKQSYKSVRLRGSSEVLCLLRTFADHHSLLVVRMWVQNVSRSNFTTLGRSWRSRTACVPFENAGHLDLDRI